MTATPSTIVGKTTSTYAIPESLLDLLVVRSIQSASESIDKPNGHQTQTDTPLANNESTSSLACQTCLGVTFATLEEQRAHFKSDWHRYNAKALSASKTSLGPLTAEQFEQANQDLSSLSGSASDSSDDQDSTTPGPTDRIARLLTKQRISSSNPTSEIDSDEEAEQVEYRRRANLRTALIWFSVQNNVSQSLVPQDTQIGVYRALLPPGVNDPSTFMPALRSVQISSDPFDAENPQERKITLLMVAGGHFAGMVVSLKPLSLTHGKGKKPERQDVKGAGDMRILQHKTFHRYTTRKKQGGSQALNDNAKSKAVSAGAMLRRYGEQSLQEEIQRLMIEWQDEIRTSERIFLRASTAGKKSFWGYEGAILDKGDERIKTFPFPTRRPTQSELIRCYYELTRIKISHLSEEALKSLEEAYIASLQPKNKPIVKPQQVIPTQQKPLQPKLSSEEEAHRERTNRLVDMTSKGRLEVLQSFWEKYKATDFGNSVNFIIEDWAEEGAGMTLLMIAAQSDQEQVVKWLLEEQRADPTVTTGAPTPDHSLDDMDDQEATAKSRGKTAYDLATSKPVRNLFRRLAHDYPDWHDWIGQAHVPSGLSQEKELEQEKKKADRRRGLRERAKEREAKRPTVAQVPEAVETAPEVPAAPISGPQKLGGGRAGGETSLAGLTPEMRMRIERERRARAAEARMMKS